MSERVEALKELGRRLAACRRQAGLEPEELSERSGVALRQLMDFERGQGGLGSGGLVRLAQALGVAPTAFLHTSAPVERASTEPLVLLKARTVGAALSESDHEFVARGLHRARAFSALGDLLRLEHLADSFQPSPPDSQEPHVEGYACARRARTLLPERQGPLRGLGRLIENRFDILVLRHTFEHPAVLGVSCRSDRARLIVISSRVEREPMRRFVLAHELGHHLLHLQESDVRADEGFIEASGFWMENPPVERRANAFAAMLLAPEEAVARELGAPRPEGYGLADARELVVRARRLFSLSFSAMAWHLYNLRYLKVRETVDALPALPDGEPLEGFEEDTRFEGLERRVLQAYAQESISASRARELLGHPVEELTAT
jgi:Zn-dependent peptidase ImmA (M78 family)/transcriptional regulator with XRE-family HTH domain